MNTFGDLEEVWEVTEADVFHDSFKDLKRKRIQFHVAAVSCGVDEKRYLYVKRYSERQARTDSSG